MKRHIFFLFTIIAGSLYNYLPAISPSDIGYWIGEGGNESIVSISWNDGKKPETLAWGYRTGGGTTIIDMLNDLVKNDPRLFSLMRQQGIYKVDGLGFDLNGEHTISMTVGGNTAYPKYSKTGQFAATPGNYNTWRCSDDEDHWNSPSKTEAGEWHCCVITDDGTKTILDAESVNSQTVQNGYNYIWYYEIPGKDLPPYEQAIAVDPYITEDVDYTHGIFFINEDWFGWDNGSLNFLDKNGKMIYRAFRRENGNTETLGITTQFGCIYGDNFYFISKQAKTSPDAKSGGRLVIADARTLKKKIAFDEIGGGDGRSFLGVNEKTGYIGAANGIFVFDMENFKLGDIIEGTGKGSTYEGQIGIMIRTGEYVFAAKQNTGVLVIDPDKNEIKTTIDLPQISTITMSKDGYIWAGAETNYLLKINPYTLETSRTGLPDGMQINSSWGAWNAGSLCASTQHNILYFTHSSHIIRYDIDNDTFDTEFFELPGQESEYKQIFYGSCLRVDPVTDNLIITATESGYLTHFMQNWIHVVDGTSGALINTIRPETYYWFPALPVFPDNYFPLISGFENISMETNIYKIYLGDKVSDADNMACAILKTATTEDTSVATVSVEADTLVITGHKKGKTTLTLKVNSNGKTAVQTVSLEVGKNSSSNKTNLSPVSVSPNPAKDILTIKGRKGHEVSLVNKYGQIILRHRITSDSEKINIASLPGGLYILQISSKGEPSDTVKVLKL